MAEAHRSPLFRLIERYVLEAIGHLPPEGRAEAQRLVKALFKTRVDWRQFIREQFGLTEDLDAQLRALWAQAREAEPALTPQTFATAVVAENFADALEMLATEILGPRD